jgi:hypothetical protein
MGTNGNPWKATTAIWVAVLALTVTTALTCNQFVPDAPLSKVDLAVVAFFWFLVSFGVRWIWRRRRDRRPLS